MGGSDGAGLWTGPVEQLGGEDHVGLGHRAVLCVPHRLAGTAAGDAVRHAGVAVAALVAEVEAARPAEQIPNDVLLSMPHPS